MDKLADMVIKFRWIIIVGFIAVALFFGSRLPQAEIDAEVKSQLPENMSSRLALEKIEDVFGGTEIAMIAIEADDVLAADTLERVKNLSRRIKRIRGVNRVLSLFEAKDIRGEEGMMLVDPAVDRIPRNNTERENLRRRLKTNDMVFKLLVSEDFQAMAIISLLASDVDDVAVTSALRQAVEEIPGREKVHFSGLPFIRVSLASDMRGDLLRFLPLGLLIMLIFLFLCFRRLRGVILPFLVVLMSIAVGMGMLPLLGWKIQMVTILLPVMMIAIANDYGIHLMSKYQEDNQPGGGLSSEQLARRGILGLGRPVIATGLTTIAGMLCLLTHVIIPAERLGVQAAVGILFALAASLLFIPAVLSLLPKSRPILMADPSRRHFMEKMLQRFSRFVTGRPKAVLAAAAVLFVGVGVGILFVTVDTNPTNYYSDNHPFIKASDLVNREFGGSMGLSILAEGDIKDPFVLNEIDRLERELKEIPHIGNTTSLARVVRQMSRALNDENEPGYDRIPETRNAVAQYFELYSMSGDPDDFEKMVDFPYEKAQISARIDSESMVVVRRVLRKVNRTISGRPLFTTVGGFPLVFSQLVDKIVHGQVVSLVMSIVVVGLLVMLLFRSFGAGVTAVVPLLLALVMLFGLMGYFNIELSIVTAMLSSIMIGVGVDYTIHFLWRYREERNRGLETSEAVAHTINTVGRGIVFNALSVLIGFVVLFISNFLPIRFFAFLIMVSISTCLMGGLVLLPAYCIVFRPRFLEPRANDLINGGN